MDSYRVWADVDLRALEANLDKIGRACGARVERILVVKADAYGHGAVAIAHHAVRCGVGALGVGTSAEALELRRAGICVPILILGTVVDEEVLAVLAHGIHVGVHSSSRARMLQETAQRLGVLAQVHLNVDTGMGRLGVLPQKAVELLVHIRDSSHLELAGIMTHFSSAGSSDATQTESALSDHDQIDRFESVLDAATERGITARWVHAANSSALFRQSSPLYDAVRVGIAAYGILPGGDRDGTGLEPVMALRSQVIFLKDVPRDATVGYDRTWVASRDSRIATLPVGYNDGVAWRLSNRGEVLVRGRRAPIVGRVSMDYTTIDVTGIPGVDVGDIATLIGRDGEEEIRVEEVARQAETIPYEITCSVGKRVERVFDTIGIQHRRRVHIPAAAGREAHAEACVSEDPVPGGRR